MAEAELHILRARMRGGLLNKARRGALALRLPIGYRRLADGGVVQDPDEQVRTMLLPQAEDVLVGARPLVADQEGQHRIALLFAIDAQAVPVWAPRRTPGAVDAGSSGAGHQDTTARGGELRWSGRGSGGGAAEVAPRIVAQGGCHAHTPSRHLLDARPGHLAGPTRDQHRSCRTSPPAGPAVFVAIAQPSGAQEVPPVTDTAGQGTAIYRLSLNETTLDYTLVATQLTSAPVAAHIHAPAPPGQNAPVVAFLFPPTSNGFCSSTTALVLECRGRITAADLRGPLGRRGPDQTATTLPGRPAYPTSARTNVTIC